MRAEGEAIQHTASAVQKSAYAAPIRLRTSAAARQVALLLDCFAYARKDGAAGGKWGIVVKPPFNTTAIIGLGLIGSSIARALCLGAKCRRIIAYDRNSLALQFALEHGFIHQAAATLEDAVEDADLIILATPPSTFGLIAEEISAHIKPGALVTDTASVKIRPIEAITPYIPDFAMFIPGHPIAGSEQSGVKAGKADLFAGNRVTLTPLAPDTPGLEQLTAFWQMLGATVEYMPPDVHDRVYAYVSHLPHWLSFALKDMLEPWEKISESSPYFKRFTRLGYSDEHLWEDIFTSNKTNIDQALARYLVFLRQIRDELAGGALETPSSFRGENIAEEVFTQALPRIISSCLVGAVYQEERQSGFGFSRYAGPGFKDFTACLQEDPDNHLEFISNHAQEVVAALDLAIGAITFRIVTKD